MPFPGNAIKVQAEVQQVYKVINKSSGAVGGYGHNGPVYGEVTMGAFQKVVNYMREHLEFGPDSAFLDIGSGLGKPNLHVAVDPGVKLSFGVELEELRWQLSMHNLRHLEKECPSFHEAQKAHNRPTVFFTQADACDIADFSPFTHIYQFDIGFPPAALVSIANAFNVSRTVKALVSFQRPLKIIQTYGFAVECVGKIQTRMCGSSEGHTAYIYKALHNIKKSKRKRGKKEAVEDTQEAVEAAAAEEEEVGPEVEELEEGGARVRRRSPVKQRRRQQTQLDKHFSFRPAKRLRSSKKQPVVEGTLKGTAEPKELFPTATIASKKSSAASYFQDGIDILSSHVPGAAGPAPSRYEEWLASEESDICGGRDRPRRSAKRVLYTE